ncbi:SPOR domain-containing protein [Ekhidna sp.]
MNNQSNRGNKTLLIILVIILLIGSALGIWYWGIYKPEQEAKEKARLEQVAKQEAEQKRKEQEAQKKINYDELIENADTEFEQENWETAYSLYSDASSLFPNQQYPQDQLALVNAELDEKAALEAKRAAGIVETVSSLTGRFYIIISSSVDGDLAMDYASKLSKEGNNVKIIEPDATTNKLFHRVSVGDYDTWDQAVNASTSFTNYGSEIWVLKY